VDTLSVEAQLVERAKAQDEAAFEQIMSLYADRLYNYILRMVGNATDAEDLVQETFLRAYQGLPNFDGRASLGTWLYRIATNLCIDHQRRRAPRCRRSPTRRTTTRTARRPSGISPTYRRRTRWTLR